MFYIIARLWAGVSVLTLALAQASLAQDQASARAAPSSAIHYPGMRDAQKVPFYASPWEGPYVGVAAGYTLNAVKTNGNVNGQYGLAAIPASLKDNVVAHGFEGGVFAGYGRLLASNFLAAAELSADLSDAEGKISKSSAVNAGGGLSIQNLSVKIQKKESFGGAIRIGKFINGFLPYAKVGVVATRWRMNFAHNLDVVSAQKTRRAFLPGVQAGFGVEMPLSEKMRVRVEYSFAAYSSMQTKLAFANAMSSYTANAKIRPLSHTLKLGVAMPLRYN